MPDADVATNTKTFRASGPVLLLGFLGSCLFVYFTQQWVRWETEPATLAFAIFALVFFGAMALRTLYLIISGKEQLVITAQGFALGAWSNFVSWNDVDEIFLATQKVRRGVPAFKYICFNMKPDWISQDSRGWGKRLLSRINLRMGFGYLTLNTLPYSHSYQHILTEVFDAFQNAVKETERTEDWCGVAGLEEDDNARDPDISS